MSQRSPAILVATHWAAAIRGRARLGHTIEVHESIGSTNDRARALLEDPAGEGVVVLAEEQRAGRGRRGRSWLSPPGLNLMISVGVRPGLPARDAWQLGLAAGLAALAACRAATPGAELGLKWPNDVVTADGRKVGGLLIETAVRGELLDTAVVGIGLNANWSSADMPPEIATTATSLADLAGASIDRVLLLDALLDALDQEVRELEAGTSPLARYRADCTTLGKEVEVLTDDGLLVGHAVDVDAAGALVLERQGTRTAVATGDVTALRPVVRA